MTKPQLPNLQQTVANTIIIIIIINIIELMLLDFFYDYNDLSAVASQLVGED